MEMLYFILGVAFCLIFMPFIDGIMQVFTQFIDLICTKIAVLTYKEKKQIEEEPQELEPCIGFQYTPKEEYDEEDEAENTEDHHCGFIFNKEVRR